MEHDVRRHAVRLRALTAPGAQPFEQGVVDRPAVPAGPSDGREQPGSARSTLKPSVSISTSAPADSSAFTQRRTSASVAASSRPNDREARADGGAETDPRSIATRDRRPSGQQRRSTASTIGCRHVIGERSRAVAAAGAARHRRVADVADAAGRLERLPEVLRDLEVAAAAALAKSTIRSTRALASRA